MGLVATVSGQFASMLCDAGCTSCNYPLEGTLDHDTNASSSAAQGSSLIYVLLSVIGTKKLRQ